MEYTLAHRCDAITYLCRYSHNIVALQASKCNSAVSSCVDFKAREQWSAC